MMQQNTWGVEGWYEGKRYIFCVDGFYPADKGPHGCELRRCGRYTKESAVKLMKILQTNAGIARDVTQKMCARTCRAAFMPDGY